MSVMSNIDNIVKSVGPVYAPTSSRPLLAHVKSKIFDEYSANKFAAVKFDPCPDYPKNIVDRSFLSEYNK